MWIALLLISAALIWFGIDALLLARHASPPNPIEKDEMIFGKGHKRPIPDRARAFAERRYPIATGASGKIYGWLFIAVGIFFGILGWGALKGGA